MAGTTVASSLLKAMVITTRHEHIGRTIMKKKLIITALVTGIGFSTISLVHAGWGQNNKQAPGPQIQYNQVDPAVKEKLDAFFADTQDIRKEMTMKRAEKQALIRNNNPDPEALGTVEGELFDLRTTMRLKAEEAGVSQYLGPMNGPTGKRQYNVTNNGRGRGGRNLSW